MEGLSQNPFYDELKTYCKSGGGGGGEIEERDSIGPMYKSINFQRGYGIGYVDPMPYEKYGLGFGDTISNLFRMAVPYLKRGLKHLGRKAVETAANVAQDAIEGENVPESMKLHAGATARELMAKAPEAFSRIINKNDGRIDTGVSPMRSVRAGRAQKRTRGARSRAGKRIRTGKGYPVFEDVA
jgi:hypothetical protein